MSNIENFPVQSNEDCGMLYDHDATPSEPVCTVCKECGAVLSEADWE